MSLQPPRDDAHRPARRSLRLKDYDYSSNGAYFVTLCCEARLCLFGTVLTATTPPSTARGPEPEPDTAEAVLSLSKGGELVLETWKALPSVFPGLEVDESVLMPNHLHGIVILSSGLEGSNYTLGDVIGRFKTFTSHLYHQGVVDRRFPPYRGRVWQRNYFEHVIRNDLDLNRVRKYIAENPFRWAEDEENPNRRG